MPIQNNVTLRFGSHLYPQTMPNFQSTMEVQDELVQITKQLELLKMDNLLQRDEILALKASARSHQDEISSLNHQIQIMRTQVLQDTPARNIGQQVRLRYLERHRQRMGRSIGKQGYDRIKCGDRAAHRGRPVVDAILCLSGLMVDQGVYVDLYGVSPAVAKGRMHAVPEMVEVMGFRASLMSEGRLTPEFQNLFRQLIEVGDRYSTGVELERAFREDKVLQQCHNQLQDCYDKIIAAGLR